MTNLLKSHFNDFHESLFFNEQGSTGKLEDRLQKKCFCTAKTKRPEKDITVSAKVLRKCSASSLILLWQPKSA